MKKWICMAALASSAAISAPITYEFSGVIDAVTDAGPPGTIYEGLPAYFPSAGMAFSGQITWDPDTLMPGFTSCNGGPNCGGFYDLSITFGSTLLADLWTTSADYSLSTEVTGDTIAARAEIAQATWSNGGSGGPLEVLALDFAFASALGDPASLAILPDDFVGGALYVVDGFAFDTFSGTLDAFEPADVAPVAEPGTLALFGAGIVGLLSSRRRRA